MKALKKYFAFAMGASKKGPAFRVEGGMCYEKAQLNKDLKTMLGPWIRYGGKISSHSFRAGLASALARGGVNDAEIKSMGRWTSEAFKRYVLLPRLTRCRMAKNVMKLLK